MESEEIISLRKILEVEKNKNKALKHQIELKTQENTVYVRITQKQRLLEGNIPKSLEIDPKLSKISPENKGTYHNFIECEEENIANSLQKVLHEMVKEKIELESMLEEEQEYIVNAMSRQVAQVLSEKLWVLHSDLKRKVEFQARSRSVSDADSAREPDDSITDSSFSSDSETGREFEEKKRVKLLENELQLVKKQIRMTKHELKKYKKLNNQLRSNQQKLLQDNFESGKTVTLSEEGDTDRSDFSIESYSSGPDNRSREASTTPKRDNH